MIRATIIAGETPNARSYGDYDFVVLPTRGDTIVVDGGHDAEIVRVTHIEHYPARIDPRHDLGDRTDHSALIFVKYVEIADGTH